MTELSHRLYKTGNNSLQFIFADGGVGIFKQGRYFTDDKLKIKELDRAINGGNTTIYVDPNEVYIDPTMEDPEAKLKAKLREEIMAELALQTNFGTTANAASINPTSTQDSGSVIIGSGDTATAVNILADKLTQLSK